MKHLIERTYIFEVTFQRELYLNQFITGIKKNVDHQIFKKNGLVLSDILLVSNPRKT